MTVLEGRLDPFITGVLYCHTIAACYEVGDVLRMTRWTDLAERWLTTVPAEVPFGALCAVHRAQLQLLRGRGTRLSWERGRWLQALTSTGSTMPHRPGTSLPRFAGCAVRRALPKRTTRRTPADTTRNRGRRCFDLPMVTPRVRWRRRSRPWPRQVPIRARPAVCSVGRDRDRRRTSAERGGCRVRARADGIHLRHIRIGGDGGNRARCGVAG